MAEHIVCLFVSFPCQGLVATEQSNLCSSKEKKEEEVKGEEKKTPEKLIVYQDKRKTWLLAVRC